MPEATMDVLVTAAANSPRTFVSVCRELRIEPREAANALDPNAFDGGTRVKLQQLHTYLSRPAWLRVFSGF
ncbi:MAG: hypothetical protein JOZ46_06680 [Candidatus Dormibacteraeota bacterium]|nr:hypothetical protein [Candidatus Dormibacteraeota bacterium]MBV9525482.1 hypothetical protein [Candidatus Dormibacteraeota bacterium]